MSNLSFLGSPFDQIRHVDENGIEYWTGRELMSMLDYPRWADFKPVIENAIDACENTGNPVKTHFSGFNLKTSGRPMKDYKLSRYGCYLTAMSGDSSKQRVAEAKTYFAVKTHQAEQSDKAIELISDDPILAQLDLLRQVRQKQLDQDRQLKELSARLAQFEQVQADAHKELIALPPASHDVPPESLDMKVRRVVNNYCAATGLSQSEVFRNLYQQHYYRYRRIVQPVGRESKLQSFVRLGLIQSLYDLAIELFADQQSA